MNFFSGYNFTLKGDCDPQFEPLRRELEEYFRTGLESRAQLCVFVGEEKVIGKCDEFQFHTTMSLLIASLFIPIIQKSFIDLHGSIYDNDDFGPSNLIPIFSAGKV